MVLARVPNFFFFVITLLLMNLKLHTCIKIQKNKMHTNEQMKTIKLNFGKDWFTAILLFCYNTVLHTSPGFWTLSVPPQGITKFEKMIHSYSHLSRPTIGDSRSSGSRFSNPSLGKDALHWRSALADEDGNMSFHVQEPTFPDEGFPCSRTLI